MKLLQVKEMDEGQKGRVIVEKERGKKSQSNRNISTKRFGDSTDCTKSLRNVKTVKNGMKK